MSDINISGQAVYEAEIVMPRSGAWTATVQLDAEAKLPKSLALTYKDQTWTCALVEGGVYGGRYLARLVGGANGLRTKLPAKWYRDVSVRAILADLARESGETFSSTILAGVLERILPTWTRQEGSTGGAIGELAAALEMTWRVLRDGTVWIGAETWPEATGQFVVTDERPQNGRITVAPEAAFLIPGTTFRGKKVTEVEYSIKADSIRANVLLESSGLASVFEAIVRFFTRSDRYRAAYFGRVVTQNDNGTLDIELETTIVPSPTKVPIRYGLPGISAKVKQGARVAVTYEDGDSRRPVATVWDAAEVEELNVTAKNVKVHAASVELGDGGRPIARSGDIVRSGGLGLMVSFLTPGTSLGGPGPVVPGQWYPVFFWMPPGLPSPSLPGQISAFSANKSSLLCAAVQHGRTRA